MFDLSMASQNCLKIVTNPGMFRWILWWLISKFSLPTRRYIFVTSRWYTALTVGLGLFELCLNCNLVSNSFRSHRSSSCRSLMLSSLLTLSTHSRRCETLTSATAIFFDYIAPRFNFVGALFGGYLHPLEFSFSWSASRDNSLSKFMCLWTASLLPFWIFFSFGQALRPTLPTTYLCYPCFQASRLEGGWGIGARYFRSSIKRYFGGAGGRGHYFLNSKLPRGELRHHYTIFSVRALLDTTSSLPLFRARPV